MKRSLDTQMLEAESQAAATAGSLHGVVVAAGRADKLDVLWSWGDAAVVPARQPMRPDAVFDVASVTKAVATATACGICIDRGLLDPDAPVRTYLPQIGELPGSDMLMSYLT